MPHEIYINALQHELGKDGLARRRLTPAEVHQRALDRRPGWIAWHLGRIGDEALIAAALDTDAHLAADLEPRMLDGNRIGIVVDDALVARIAAALAA